MKSIPLQDTTASMLFMLVGSSRVHVVSNCQKHQHPYNISTVSRSICNQYSIDLRRGLGVSGGVINATSHTCFMPNQTTFETYTIASSYFLRTNQGIRFHAAMQYLRTA